MKEKMQILAQMPAAQIGNGLTTAVSNGLAKTSASQNQAVGFMQLLQMMLGNQTEAMFNAESNINESLKSMPDTLQDEKMLENKAATMQGDTLYINPEVMLLLQAVLSPGEIQAIDKTDANIIKPDSSYKTQLVDPLSLLSLGENLDLLLESSASANNNQLLSSLGALAGEYQIGNLPVNLLPLEQGSINNLSPKQAALFNLITGLNTTAAQPLTDMTIEKPTDQVVLPNVLKNVLNGMTKDSSAAQNNLAQFSPKNNSGFSVPEQVNAVNMAAVEGKINNNVIAEPKTEVPTLGITPQQGTVTVSPDAAGSGAKNSGQQFTRQDSGNSGSPIAAAGLENFSIKSTGGDIIQQLRVNDNTFVAKFAEIIKSHTGKDSSGQTHIKLQLQPENLGQVIVKLVFKDGNISSQFIATTEHAKQIIESSLPQLREVLANFQLNLQNASVVAVGNEDRDTGRWGRDWNQNGGKKGRHNRLDSDKEDVKVAGNLFKTTDEAVQSQLNYFI